MNDGRLDDLLRDARPEPLAGPDSVTWLRDMIDATQAAANGRRRRRGLVASTAAVVVLGVGGTAAASVGFGVPGWITNFGYDADYGYTDTTGTTCHQALLVSPYVSEDDQNPPSRATLDRVVRTARAVVSDYDFSSMEEPSRADFSSIGAAIDAELRRRGLPEAYTLGFMGDCEPGHSR